ncbi:MAG: biosynthetic-type acetolactate synthase large subunit [Bacteroidales bacterium]|nr:biosynthetic-type acetolactate synthase large subunit [Bacteroidales bacterium]
MKIKGSEALMHGLIAEGVDRVFGYPGGTIMPVYDTLYDFSDRITHVLVRHEQGAIHAAQGYARVSGRTGVVIVTSGPGATNVLTGLGDSLMDSTPIVVITGQVGANWLGSDAFQETDIVCVAKPLTKWAYQVRTADEIPSALARAFYIASTGRPGPVVIDITKDAQQGLTDVPYTPCRYIRSYNPDPEVSEADLLNVANLINASKAPMILAGQGITISGAEDELRRLAEKADIPVACTLLGRAAISTDHPLNKGMLGMHGHLGPNVNTNKADLLIALGMRFDDRVTGDLDTYARQAKVIHVDIDPSELNKNVAATAAIHGDARKVLSALLPLVRETRRPEWLATFDAHARVEAEQVMERELHPTDPAGPMLMGEVAVKLAEAFDDNTVLVTDVGQNQMMGARYFSFTRPRSIITSGGLGTMGFGFPAAIGAKMGAPERTVFYFGGDGGFQMTMQELGTIMQYGTDVKIIILNNNFLGNVRQWQALFFGGRFSQTPMVNPDFVAIAGAYGIKAENVERRDQLDGAISRMKAHKGAYLLNINIDETDMVFPMTPAGGSVDDILLNPTEKYRP